MSPHPAIDLLASTWLAVLCQELITSLLLAIAIWAVLRLLRQRSARLHHAVWALVLARLALPLEWASPASLRSALGLAALAAFILPMASVDGTAADPAGAPGPAIMTAAAGAPSAEVSGLSAALPEDAIGQDMDAAATGSPATGFPATGSPATAVPGSAEAGGSDDRDIPRYKDDGPITAPKQLEAAPPVYPEEARTERIQGAVVLETVIEADGTVSEVTPLRYPDPALRDAAVEAIHKWRFEPATLEGEPVAVRYVLTVMFRLE